MQLNVGRELSLRSGSAGIIFGITGLCDLKFEAVEWTMRCAREVGSEEVSGRRFSNAISD